LHVIFRLDGELRDADIIFVLNYGPAVMHSKLIISYMGELCKYTAEVDMGIQALRSGLEACKQGSSTSERYRD
jgi:hypothetical protein